VIAFSVLVIVLDDSVLNVALPAIVRQLHASSSQLQWMVDAYSLAFAGLLLTMGSLGDKYGRRAAFQIGRMRAASRECGGGDGSERPRPSTGAVSTSTGRA